ncbi:MarR family transcriptional regulator [Aciduricibacillus chroicocephali]|uniref:MarR family transcriptional regulator n=1 Tax=Aciduricibacillus chroicocephali TaxID=3054939 RepID=A0ABY9KXJ7_9BACI|nr:MarR family transcriptional regulator [Bacillaceae bacterium 44XB]
MDFTKVAERYQAAMRTIGSNINRIIRETAHPEIKRELFFTLQYIVHQRQTTNTEIAGNFEVGKSTITAQINRLENLGLIMKTGNAKDKRTIYLVATEQGSALIRKIERRIIDLIEEKLTTCHQDEILLFVSQLEKLAALLQK